MTAMPIYQALAHAFAAEGVKAHFTLMGDGNMHWATAMKNLPGMDTYYARHEHCACAMATGYHSATGDVGVASVTCGPGFTQIMTALTTAARSRIPLVVFTGEVPINARWYGQAIEQPPLAAATGAHYISAHAPSRMYQYVREAFFIARHERRPVVLGVPYDIQKQPLPALGDYQPSAAVLPHVAPIPPNAAQVAALAAKLAAAQCPILVAGKGVMRAGAQAEIEALAEATGALLATTLPTRGLYDHNPFSLGISGGYARAIAREMGGRADLVVAFGASLSHYTLDGGSMYPRAELAQVDIEPAGLHHGMRGADLYLRADAKLTAQALLDALRGGGKPKAAIRTDELARRIKQEPADATVFPAQQGLLDPRDVTDELERVIPKDYDCVCGSGHQSYFHTNMRGYRAENYHAIREFAAIGNGISHAIGVAAAKKNGKVVLFDGDGSFLMHIQELEMIQRHGLKILVVINNDGAYGSEIHKLRADGIDDSGSIFGRTDLAAIARGFGLRGNTIRTLDEIGPLFAAYAAQDTAELWNIEISDQVVNPGTRRALEAGHAKK